MSLANPKHNSKCDFKGLQLPLWRFNTILPSACISLIVTQAQGYYAGRKVTSLAWGVLLDDSFRHIIGKYRCVIRAALKMFVSFRDHGAHTRVG